MSKRTEASLEFAPVGDLAPVVFSPESCPSASFWTFFNNRGRDQRPDNGGMEMVNEGKEGRESVEWMMRGPECIKEAG